MKKHLFALAVFALVFGATALILPRNSLVPEKVKVSEISEPVFGTSVECGGHRMISFGNSLLHDPGCPCLNR